MQAAPLAALIPLLIMAYGIGLTSKVFVASILGVGSLKVKILAWQLKILLLQLKKWLVLF